MYFFWDTTFWPHPLFILINLPSSCGHFLSFFLLGAPHGMWDFSSPSRDRIHAPALEVHSPNQWTSMQFMASSLLDCSLFQVHDCILILFLLFSILGTQRNNSIFLCRKLGFRSVNWMEMVEMGWEPSLVPELSSYEFAWVWSLMLPVKGPK